MVNAKNSTWSAYLYQKFMGLYGASSAALIQKKDKADAKKLLECELDQSIPMSVYVKEDKNWKFVDFFYTSGREISRDMIMEINLDNFKNVDHIQVKLETTYMFWDLDFVGMDFSEDLPYETAYIAANNQYKSGSSSAVAERHEDGNIHLSDKEQLNLDFKVNPIFKPNTITSYFLVGQGYYHDNTPYEGKANLEKLASFSKKGAFDRFSHETFDELAALLANQPANSVAIKN